MAARNTYNRNVKAQVGYGCLGRCSIELFRQWIEIYEFPECRGLSWAFCIV